jgi:hypothetical protein
MRIKKVKYHGSLVIKALGYKPGGLGFEPGTLITRSQMQSFLSK